MKKVCWLLILVLMLGCFVGCAADTENIPESITIEEYGETLTQKQKNEILNAYNPKGNSLSFSGWLDDGTGLGRYYGTESGYAILFVPSALAMETNIVVGEYTFHHPSGFNLFAYRNKTFYKLAEVYDQGLISDDAVRTAWEKHTEIEEQRNQDQS